MEVWGMADDMITRGPGAASLLPAACTHVGAVSRRMPR